MSHYFRESWLWTSFEEEFELDEGEFYMSQKAKSEKKYDPYRSLGDAKV